MAACFLDTCALQHKYVDSAHSRRVRSLVTRSRSNCFIADRTVVEMASTFARQCRSNGWGITRYDRLYRQFLRDLADGTLQIWTCGPREVRRSIHIIRFAGVLKRKSLSSGDGVLASCALEMALDAKQVVDFYTSDWPLYSSLRDLNAFRATMNLHLVGSTKDGSPPSCRVLVQKQG
jgi:hypothetical protein